MKRFSSWLKDLFKRDFEKSKKIEEAKNYINSKTTIMSNDKAINLLMA